MYQFHHYNPVSPSNTRTTPSYTPSYDNPLNLLADKAIALENTRVSDPVNSSKLSRAPPSSALPVERGVLTACANHLSEPLAPGSGPNSGQAQQKRKPTLQGSPSMPSSSQKRVRTNSPQKENYNISLTATNNVQRLQPTPGLHYTRSSFSSPPSTPPIPVVAPAAPASTIPPRTPRPLYNVNDDPPLLLMDWDLEESSQQQPQEDHESLPLPSSGKPLVPKAEDYVDEATAGARWPFKDKNDLFKFYLGTEADEMFKIFKVNPMHVFKKASIELFQGRHSPDAVKGMHQRALRTYGWIVAFEKFTGGGGDADADDTQDILAQHSQKLQKARAAGINVGSLSAKTVDEWHDNGWYTLFHNRFSTNPSVDGHSVRRSGGDVSVIDQRD